MATDQDVMNQIAAEWLVARNIITNFLQEVSPYQPRDVLEHNAAAILARLAQHEPPILIGFSHQSDDAKLEAAEGLAEAVKTLIAYGECCMESEVCKAAYDRAEANGRAALTAWEAAKAPS